MSISFSDLALAAYCPRKLYYARTIERPVPSGAAERMDLGFRYADLLEAPAGELAALPIDVPPETYRENLRTIRAKSGCWEQLTDPPEREVVLAGRECHGVIHKVLALETPVPSILSPGRPPERGVWEPQSVRAVAAAKALAWEHEQSVSEAFVEYPASGVVRRIELTTRRKAAYRTASRAARSIDGPPPRLRNQSKCEPCEFRDTCGVRTRSLRSMLGIGDG